MFSQITSLDERVKIRLFLARDSSAFNTVKGNVGYDRDDVQSSGIGNVCLAKIPCLLGDCHLDWGVNFLAITPFVER